MKAPVMLISPLHLRWQVFLFGSLLGLMMTATAAAHADFQTTATTSVLGSVTAAKEISTTATETTHGSDSSTTVTETILYTDGSKLVTTTVTHSDGSKTITTTNVGTDGTENSTITDVAAPSSGSSNSSGSGFGSGSSNSNSGGGSSGSGNNMVQGILTGLASSLMNNGGVANMMNGLQGSVANATGASMGTINPSDAAKATDKANTQKTKPQVQMCQKPMTDEEKKQQADARQAQLAAAEDKGARDELSAKFHKEDEDRAKLPKCPEVDYTKPNGVSSKITSMADAKAMEGKQIGNGQCAVLVENLSPGVGLVKTWTKGEQVMGNTDIPIGTPIATFNYQDGTAYAPLGSSGVSGGSHSAIYLGQNDTGVVVLNQWSSSGGARISTIPWNSWSGSSAEAGNKYYVVVPSGSAFNFNLFPPFWLAWNVVPFSGGLLQAS